MRFSAGNASATMGRTPGRHAWAAALSVLAAGKNLAVSGGAVGVGRLRTERVPILFEIPA
jgi:hypothetical protein